MQLLAGWLALLQRVLWIGTRAAQRLLALAADMSLPLAAVAACVWQLPVALYSQGILLQCCVVEKNRVRVQDSASEQRRCEFWSMPDCTACLGWPTCVRSQQFCNLTAC